MVKSLTRTNVRLIAALAFYDSKIIHSQYNFRRLYEMITTLCKYAVRPLYIKGFCAANIFALIIKL